MGSVLSLANRHTWVSRRLDDSEYLPTHVRSIYPIAYPRPAFDLGAAGAAAPNAQVAPLDNNANSLLLVSSRSEQLA